MISSSIVTGTPIGLNMLQAGSSATLRQHFGLAILASFQALL
jgi:hypothetical protein